MQERRTIMPDYIAPSFTVQDAVSAGLIPPPPRCTGGNVGQSCTNSQTGIYCSASSQTGMECSGDNTIGVMCSGETEGTDCAASSEPVRCRSRAVGASNPDGEEESR